MAANCALSTIALIVSPSRQIAKCLKEKHYGDNLAAFLSTWNRCWIVGTLLVCLLLVAITSFREMNSLWLRIPLFYIAFSRWMEIVWAFYNDGFDRLANRGPDSTLSRLDRIRMAILNYVELSMHFAIAYYFVPVSNMFEPPLNGFFDALYFSGVTITTLGYGDIAPLHMLSRLMVILEVFSGLLIVLFALAIYISWNDGNKHSSR